MTKIIQRHDTAANWTSINPVLAAGEMGVETDTNKFKFGNGTSTWSELAYSTSGSSGGGSGTQLTSADGTTEYGKLALGDTLAVSDGVLNANLDSKQDKLEAGNGISINTVIEGSMTPDWYLNGAKLDPVPDTINTPAKGVTNTYRPYNNQTFSNTVENITITWETLYAYTSSSSGSSIQLNGSDGYLTLDFDGGYQGADSILQITGSINSSTTISTDKFTIPYQADTYIRNTFTFDKTTNTWEYKCINTNTEEIIKSQTGTTTKNIIPTNSVVSIVMKNVNNFANSITVKTSTFNVAGSTKKVTKINAKYDNSTIKVNESGELYADTPKGTTIQKEIQFPLNLTSNGTLGGSTPSCSGSSYESNPDHPYYYAFKGATTSTPSSELWGPGSGSAGQYLILDCVTPIALQSFRWTNGGTDAERFPVIVFKGSNDNSNYTTLATYNTQNATDDSVTINNTTAYRYYKFEFPEAANWGKFGFISITGADGYDILNIGDGLEVTNNTIITAKPDNKYIRFNSNGELTTSTSVLTYGNFLDFCHNYPDEIKAALGLN